MSDTETREVRIETVRKLDLKPGDALFVQLGGDIGDGQPIWLPSDEDLQYTLGEWKSVLPEGVKVIISHPLTNVTVVRED